MSFETHLRYQKRLQLLALMKLGEDAENVRAMMAR